MSQIDEYYWRIRSTYEDFEMHEQKAMPKRAFCKKCHRVVPDWYPRMIEFRLHDISKAVAIYSRANLALVYHTGLWRQIEYLCPSAVIGPVTLQHKDGVDRFTLEWVTVLFPPSETVHVRGSCNPKHSDRGDGGGVLQGVCAECGQQTYLAVHDTGQHLVRCLLPRNQPIFMSSLGDLIIAESIAQKLDWSGFPDLKYNRLPVLDRPLDGLRLLGDPDWSAMNE